MARRLHAKPLSAAHQLEEYASRKGISVEVAEKLLAPNFKRVIAVLEFLSKDGKNQVANELREALDK